MATVRPINVTIKGEYTDADVKRAIKDLQSLQKQAPKTTTAMSGLSREFKGMLAGAAAAVSIGAITNQLRDMAMAAAQDQKSVVALNQAMANLGMGSQTSAMEDYVKATMLATGTSDELIRQGLTRLTAATGDATQSQRLLNLALDISAAGYGDVVAISTALSKAATGNVTALKRLGVPLDANAVKAKDLNAIIDDLSTTFRGQAAAAANTYAGKMQRLDTAVGEAQETIGYELLATLDELSSLLGGTGGAVSGVAALGDNFAALLRPAREVASVLGDVDDKIKSVTGGLSILESWRPTGLFSISAAWMDVGKGLQAADEQQVIFGQHLSDVKTRLIQAAQAAGLINGENDILGDTADTAAGAILRQSSAVDRLKASLDKLDGRRSAARQRIQIKRMLAEGPTPTGERTVIKDGKEVTERYVTKQDKRLFALDVADARAALADTIFNNGMGSDRARAAAAQQFSLGRRNIRGLGFGAGVAQDYLATPNELLLTKGQSAASLRYQGAGTMIMIDKVEVTANTVPEAIEKAKQAARLQSLGRGSTASAMRYAGMAAAS